MRDKSMMAQLKSQLQIERNITGDDTINVMPDSGNVDAFARKLVSAAEPVNLSLKARDGSFGAENADGVVSVVETDEDDEFNGNDNNRRVAERIAREKSDLRKEKGAAKTRKQLAREKPDGSVIGEDESETGNPNNDAVDLSQAPTLEATGGVLGHAEDGDQHPAGGMPGAAFKPAEGASDDATPKDKAGQDEAAKGGRPPRGWKPNAG